MTMPNNTATELAKHITDAYATLRRYNSSIPDDVLEWMRDSLRAAASGPAAAGTELIEAIAKLDPRVITAESCKAVAQKWLHAQPPKPVAAGAPQADDEQLGDTSAVGLDMEGIEQPYAGAVVLLETIAEFGAVPFVDGAATPMRDDCLRLARGLREAARRAGEKSTITPDVKTGAGELSKLCETFGINVREGMTPMMAIACRLKDLQDAAARAAQPATQADDNWDGHSQMCIGGKKGPCNCEAALAQRQPQDGYRYRHLRDLMRFSTDKGEVPLMTLRAPLQAPDHNTATDWVGEQFDASVDRTVDASIAAKLAAEDDE